MTTKLPPKLVNFAFDKWLEEDGDDFNIVILDAEREGIETKFAMLMASQKLDPDGRYDEAAMEAAWEIAIDDRPQIGRWINKPNIANSCGKTYPAHRELPKDPQDLTAAQPHRLGLMWSSEAGEGAVRSILGSRPTVQPNFIVTGNYFRSERPETFAAQLAAELSVSAWSLHCSGSEGPITLLAGLDEVVFVLPIQGRTPEPEIWSALPQTMRWVMWTAHLLDVPYTTVTLDGERPLWFRPSAPDTSTATAIDAAKSAREKFTRQLKKLSVEYFPDGSGLYLGNKPVPIDLMNIPFELARRISRWQEWGEALFANRAADRISKSIGAAFMDEARQIAHALKNAVGEHIVVECADTAN